MKKNDISISGSCEDDLDLDSFFEDLNSIEDLGSTSDDEAVLEGNGETGKTTSKTKSTLSFISVFVVRALTGLHRFATFALLPSVYILLALAIPFVAASLYIGGFYLLYQYSQTIQQLPLWILFPTFVFLIAAFSCLTKPLLLKKLITNALSGNGCFIEVLVILVDISIVLAKVLANSSKTDLTDVEDSISHIDFKFLRYGLQNIVDGMDHNLLEGKR